MLAPLSRSPRFLLVAYENISETSIKTDVFTATLQLEGDIYKVCPRMQNQEVKYDYDIIVTEIDQFITGGSEIATYITFSILNTHVYLIHLNAQSHRYLK